MEKISSMYMLSVKFALYFSREDRGVYIKEKMLVNTQVLYFVNLSSVLEDSQKLTILMRNRSFISWKQSALN